MLDVRKSLARLQDHTARAQQTLKTEKAIGHHFITDWSIVEREVGHINTTIQNHATEHPSSSPVSSETTSVDQRLQSDASDTNSPDVPAANRSAFQSQRESIRNRRRRIREVLARKRDQIKSRRH